MSFIITSSPNGEYDGAELVWYGYFTEKTEERTVEALITCGCTNLATLEGVTSNVVQLTVELEPHYLTGEPTSRVKWVNRLGGVAMKSRMSDGQAKGLAARMQTKFQALSKKIANGSSSPNARPVSKATPHDPPHGPAHAPTPPPIDDFVLGDEPPPGDDNIPF